MHKIILFAFGYVLPAFLFAQTPHYFTKNINASRGATMCLDAAGNVWLGATDQGQVQLIQLNPDGSMLEQARIDVKAGPGDDLSEIITDSEGMIVGCGNLDDDRGFAFRYDPVAKKVLWSNTLESQFALFNGLVENGPGGNFLAYNGLLAGGAEILALDRTTGNLVTGESRRYDLTEYRSFNAMLLHAGNLYTTGYDLATSTELRISTSKIRAVDGVPQWTRINYRENLPDERDLLGQDLVVDNDSVITVSLGGADDSGFLNMIYLQKHSPKGDVLWTKRYDLIGTSSDIPQEIVAVPDGYVIYGQSFLSSNGLHKGYFFMLKTDRNGNLRWAKHIGKDWELNSPPFYSTQSQIIATNNALYCIADALNANGQQTTYFFKTDLNGNIDGCDQIRTIGVDVVNPGNFVSDLASPSAAPPDVQVPAAVSTFSVNPNLSVQTGCSNQQPTPQVSITCPANITMALAPGQTGVVVNYTQPVATTTCSNISLTFNLLKGKASGSIFNEGSTEVCYEAVSPTCDVRNNCCFRVEIQPAVLTPCESKTIGCLRFELFSIQKDADANRIYRVRLVNQCSNTEVQSLSIQLPNGVATLSPANNSTYTAPSGRTYEVRSPNATPFYSIRFKAQGSNLPAGASDYFEYELPQQSVPAFILMSARMSDGTSLQAHLSTSACPVENAPVNKPRGADHSLAGNELPSLFPNPTSGHLLITLPIGWQDQSVRFSIWNAYGQLVQQQTSESVHQSNTLMLEPALANGLYYIMLQNTAGEQVTVTCVLQR